MCFLPATAMSNFKKNIFVNNVYIYISFHCFTFLIVQWKVMVWWVSNIFCLSYLDYCHVTDFWRRFASKVFILIKAEPTTKAQTDIALNQRFISSRARGQSQSWHDKIWHGLLQKLKMLVGFHGTEQKTKRWISLVWNRVWTLICYALIITSKTGHRLDSLDGLSFNWYIYTSWPQATVVY